MAGSALIMAYAIGFTGLRCVSVNLFDKQSVCPSNVYELTRDLLPIRSGRLSALMLPQTLLIQTEHMRVR